MVETLLVLALMAILVAFVASGLTRVRDAARDSTTRTTLAELARISAADAFTSKRLSETMFTIHAVDYVNAQKQPLTIGLNAALATTTNVSLSITSDAKAAGLALRSVTGKCVLVRVDLPTELLSDVTDATGGACSGDAALGLQPGQ